MSSRKLVNILLHILCTALIVVVPIFVMPLKHGGEPTFLEWHTIVFTALQTAGFYFSAYVLYPRLLLKKRVVSYILAILGMSFLLSLVPGCIMFASGEIPLYAIYAGVVLKIFI